MYYAATMNPSDGGGPHRQQPVELRLQQALLQQDQQQQTVPTLRPRLPLQLPPHQLQLPAQLPNQVLPHRPKFSSMVHQSQKQSFLLPQQQQQQQQVLPPSQLQHQVRRSCPKMLIIPRSDDGFGFTLRQLVTKPPSKQDATEASAIEEPLESFHVSSVKKGSNAELAGLQAGDRIVAVDGWSTTRRSFPEVVQQMQSNYGTLQLLVVPQDEDALQLALSAGNGPTTPLPTDVDETVRYQPAGMGTTGVFVTRAHHQSPPVDLPSDGWAVRRDSRSSDNYVQLAGYYSPVPLSRDQPLPPSHPPAGAGLYSSPSSLRGMSSLAADPYYVPPPRAQRALAFATVTTAAKDPGQNQGQLPEAAHGQMLADYSSFELQRPQHLQVVRATVTSAAVPGGNDVWGMTSAPAAGVPRGTEAEISSLAERDGAHSIAAAAGSTLLPTAGGAALSYQASAPRLPQQVIRAPAQVVAGSSQNERLAGNGSLTSLPVNQQQQQQSWPTPTVSAYAPAGSAGVRYLPAYGNDGSIADPIVYRAHRTGTTSVGQRPVTSAFESLTAAAYRDTATVASLQPGPASTLEVRTADAPRPGGGGSWHPMRSQSPPGGGVAADSRTESARWLQAAAATATAAAAPPGPRSPVQQETTFDSRGTVVERRTFVYEPVVSGPGHRGPTADGRSWPSSAGELRFRVASDNDLLAARPYAATGRADLQPPPSLVLASSALSLHQQPYGATGTSPQQLQPAPVKASGSVGSLLLLATQQPQPEGRPMSTYSSHPVAHGSSGSVGGRDRLPSESPGMIYNHGFANGPSTSSGGPGGSAFGDRRIMPKGAFPAGGSSTGRTRPMSYAPPVSGNMYSVMENDTGDNSAVNTSVESQSLNDLRIAFKSGQSHGEPQNGNDDSGRAQIIRRTSYMIATAPAPPRPNDGGRDATDAAQALAAASVVRQPAKRPEFLLGDPSGLKYPIFSLPGKDGSTEGSQPIQPRIAIVGQPHFDLQSPVEGTPSTPLPPSPLPITKDGSLAVKFEKIDGKKSTERSWKTLGIILCGRLLYFVKEKKDNFVMNQASDDIPVNLRNCKVDVAYGYTKKKHVFRVETSSNSEYLFQAESQEDMLAWIRAFLVCSETEKMKAPGAVDLIMQEIEQKLQSQSPVPSSGNASSKAGGNGGGSSGSSGGAAKRLAVLPFWNRQQSPGSDSSSGSKKDRRSARLLRGASSPASLSAAGVSEDEGSGSSGSSRAFGIPLADCAPSDENKFVPRVVEQCTRIIEENGLEFTGLYRIPGNSTAVGTLQEELNCGVIDLENDRWRDVNVVGSLLKLFFRKLPEPLVTAALYKSFIDAHRLEKYDDRMNRLKQLIHQLPSHNFETFKHLANHLKKVASLGHVNKMDAHNLAIVFGPTLLHPVDDSMLSIVADMAGQCGVIETVITHYEWIFSPIGEPPPELKADSQPSPAPPISETMLSMGDDIARLASRQAQPPLQPADSAPPAGTSRREHFTSLTSAAARLLRTDRSREKSKQQQPSETSTVQAVGMKSQAQGGGAVGDGSTVGSGLASSSSSDNGDHGFAERNIDEEVAARRQRFRAHEARQQLQQWQQQQQRQEHGDRQRAIGKASAGAAAPVSLAAPSSGANAVWSRVAAGTIAPQPLTSSAEPVRSQATLRPVVVGSSSDDRSPLLLYSDVASDRRVLGRSVSRWHSEESVLDQQHQHLSHHQGSGSSLWLQLPLAGFSPARNTSGSAGSTTASVHATGSWAGVGSANSTASTSPPPPPLPARRYRTASQEDALLAGPDRGATGSADDRAVYLSYFAGLCDRDDTAKQPPEQLQWGGQHQPSSCSGSQQQQQLAHRPPALLQQLSASGAATGSQPATADAANAGSITGSRKCGAADSTSSPYAPTYQNVFAQALAAGDYAADARRARAHPSPHNRQGSGSGAVSDAAGMTAAATDHRRAVSVDSTHSGSDHSSDLLAAITATFDQKLQRLLQRDDVSESDESATTDGRALSKATVIPAAASSSTAAEPQSRPGRTTETAGSIAAFTGATGSNSEHVFRDPSLNKSSLANAGRAVKALCDQPDRTGPQQLQQQPAMQLPEQSPAVQSAKIGIASRIERTDMRPAAAQAAVPQASCSGAAAWAVSSTASGQRWRQQRHQNWFPIRAGSYDSLADIDLSSPQSSLGKRGGNAAAPLSKDATAALGSREGLVRSVVDLFEQRSLVTAASSDRLAGGGAVHGSRSTGNLLALADSRVVSGPASATVVSCVSPARHKPGARRRQRRRHTIGGNLMDDYVEVAAAVELATAASRQQQQQQQQQQVSAWERLQPMVRQYEGAAPRSLRDWMVSERERVRGSFSDLYGLQASSSSSAADARGRQYSRVSAGWSQSGRQT